MVAIDGGRRMIDGDSIERYLADKAAAAESDASRMPLGTATSGGKAKPRSVADWWERRSVPASRPGLLAHLDQIEIADFSLLFLNNMALSLSGCYWLWPIANETLQWGNVNYFENDFVRSNLMTWNNWLSAIGLDSPDNKDPPAPRPFSTPATRCGTTRHRSR